MRSDSDRSAERLQTALGSRYTVLDRLGAGGMGVVYAARDERHGRSVAIKIMHDAFAESVGAARFLREIEVAARLQHPHVLPLFDSGSAEGVLYYVMPLIVGESLRDRIDREKQLPLVDVCRIARQVARALAYAHSQGVVHRDVKPHNILLTHGEAIVADFGIAKVVEREDASEWLTGTGMIIGSPWYMSPEQGSGQRDIDGRSDQYSLGCVAYEMLTGEPPFSGVTPQVVVARHVCDPPPSVRTARPNVPAAVERAIEIALAKSPADRHRTTLDFADALDTALRGSMDATERILPSTTPVAQSRGVNAGRLVSKTCDRWSQVNAFDSHLRSSWKHHPGRPQVYVIHGDEGQGHESLLERLSATTIARFADEIGGAEHGSLVKLHAPWSDAHDLDIAKRDLAISLFREADPRYMDDDLSPTALQQRVSDKLTSVAVVHHDLRASHWHVRTPELINWYANTFWGGIEAGRTGPQFLVFLKVIYPPASQGGLLRSLFSASTMSRQKITQAVARIAVDPSRCSWMMFGELTSVSVDDVKDWFNKNYVFESEREREARAVALFRGAPRRRMADIEPELAEIHEAAVNTSQPLQVVMS